MLMILSLLGWGSGILLVGMLYWSMPSVMLPTVPFGVRIPLIYAQHQTIVTEARRYRQRLALLLLLVGLWFLMSMFVPVPLFRSLGVGALILGCWANYYQSHRIIAAVKQQEQWFTATHQAVTASLPMSHQIPAYCWWLLVANVGVIGCTGILGISHHSAFPRTVHLHFFGVTMAGNSPWAILLPAMEQLFLMLLLGSGAILFAHLRQEIDVELPHASLDQHRELTHIMSAICLLLAMSVNLALFFIAGNDWHLWSDAEVPLRLGASLTMLLMVVLVFVVLRRLRVMATRISPRSSIYVNRDDDRLWKGGVIYINRDDPAIFVRRRFSIGWTLNYGHGGSWLLTTILCIMIVIRLLHH